MRLINITKVMYWVKDVDDIWDALRDLVTFVQFKKREKYPWRSATFRKVLG